MKINLSWPIRRACLLAVAAAPLGACVSTQGDAPPSVPETAETRRPSEAAMRALASAEQAMQRARAAFALWTSALAAYEQARAAAAMGDSARVIDQARIVEEQVALALRQREYPSTER
jgi:type IV pilus biogenesis protein CpaD/CtpE